MICAFCGADIDPVSQAVRFIVPIQGDDVTGRFWCSRACAEADVAANEAAQAAKDAPNWYPDPARAWDLTHNDRRFLTSLRIVPE